MKYLIFVLTLDCYCHKISLCHINIAQRVNAFCNIRFIKKQRTIEFQYGNVSISKSDIKLYIMCHGSVWILTIKLSFLLQS